jgi:hypothetical protein
VGESNVQMSNIWMRTSYTHLHLSTQAMYLSSAQEVQIDSN